MTSLIRASELDSRIEALKNQVHEHSANVFALQQSILHPANTRLAVFLTLGARDTLELDSVELYLDGEPVASHLYSARELRSLDNGGVQQLFTGNLSSGEHELKTVVSAQAANDHFVRRESVYRFTKRPGPFRIQMSLDAQAPDFEPRVVFHEWK
ncbi:AraC family transcriptional regulator [Marinobacter sp. chi1]|uniref:AraC family transcriptional regulator n=1 Tax=Marinobacter suaedae TaxID=3057675 RepID=A0ABT8W2E0_9GAMM|nr:AraC family transcriptional regulator [Marinobacter sp. chi1]MDO3722376.1 AraC family transcriptional regulator [Marinobacter sp. chi1]